jgi:hypothetical protein
VVTKVANLVKIEFPEVSAYVNASTGEYVDSPAQIEAKEVVYVVSPEELSLIKIEKYLNGKITNELLQLRELPWLSIRETSNRG